MTAYDTTIDTDSPVSHWKLGEASGTAAADRKAANAGVYQGTPTLAVAGLLATGNSTDTAVTLNGTTQYVSIVGSASLQPASVTVEAWLKVSSLAAQRTVVSLADDVFVLSITSGGKLRMQAWDGAANRILDSVATLVVNTTYFVGASFNNATGVLALYINNSLDNSTTLAISLGWDAVTTSAIGAAAAGGTKFAGTLDEVAVYNAALSQARMSAHYVAGAGADVTAPATPTGLSGSAFDARVKLNWAANSEIDLNSVPYLVDRRVSPAGTWVTLGGATGTTFTDGTAVNGTAYDYAVRAQDNASPPNVSARSSTVTVTPTQSLAGESGLAPGWKIGAPISWGRPTGPRVKRRWSDRSVWNTPIAADMKRDGYESQIAAYVDSWVISTSYPYPITNTFYEVPWDQPLVPVRMVGPDPDWATSIANPLAHLSVLGDLLWTSGVPMPAGAETDLNDNAMAILKPRHGGPNAPMDYWELYQTGGDINRIPAGQSFAGERYTVGGSIIPDIGNHAGTPGHEQYPGRSHPKWGNRASGLPYSAGVATIEEMWAGVIPHALAFLLPGARYQWHSWPAVREDSSFDSPRDQHAPMYGDRLYWDPAFDVDGMAGSPLSKTIARACRDYGFILVDQTHNRFGWTFEDAWPQYVTKGKGNPYTQEVDGHPPIYRSSNTRNSDGSWTVLDGGVHSAGAWLPLASLRVALRTIQWTGKLTEA